jgi:hypothetical protein
MNPFRKVLDHKLAEAAKTIAPTETPAIQCQVVHRHLGVVLGALRAVQIADVEGLYEILTPAKTPDGKQTLAEITIHVDDIVGLGVQRDPSPIAQPRGSSLFVPH